MASDADLVTTSTLKPETSGLVHDMENAQHKEGTDDCCTEDELMVFDPSTNTQRGGICEKCFTEQKQVPGSYCPTCDLCLCKEHKAIHDTWFGKVHNEMTVEEFKNSPKRYQKHFCSLHGSQELCLTCLECEIIACLHCDLTEACPKQEHETATHFQDTLILKSRPSGEITEMLRNMQDRMKSRKLLMPVYCFVYLPGHFHRLTSVDKLGNSFTEKYEGLITVLNEKLCAIMKLHKATMLNLEDLVQRSKDMTAEVERSVTEQVETLKTKGSLVKAEISEYVTNRTEQVSNFLAELAAKQQLVEDCIKTIKFNLMSSHITEQITDYSLQRISVDDLVKLELGSCVLVEKFVQLKGLSRELEVGISEVPHRIELLATYKSSDVSGDCESVEFLGKDKFVAGYENGLEVIAKSASGPYQGRFRAKLSGDVEALARHPDALIIALCAEEETMTVKYFTYPELEFVRDACSFWRSGNSFSHLAVTKKRQMVITDEANNQLHVFDLNGKALFTIPISGSLPSYSSVLCLPDGTITVSQCLETGSVRRMRLFESSAEVLWTCGGLQTPTGMCVNDAGLIFVGSETKKAIYMVSPSGVFVGELPLRDLPTPGVWDLSIYQGKQLAVAISERVRVYNVIRNEA